MFCGILWCFWYSLVLWYSVVFYVFCGILWCLCYSMLLCGILWCSVVSCGIWGDLVLCGVLCSVLSFSVVSCGVVFCSVLSHGVPWQLLFSLCWWVWSAVECSGCLNLIKHLWGEGKEKSEVAQSCPTLCDPMDWQAQIGTTYLHPRGGAAGVDQSFRPLWGPVYWEFWGRSPMLSTSGFLGRTHE